MPDLRQVLHLFLRFFQGGLQKQIGAENNLVGVLERLDGLFGKVAPLQADQVQAEQFGVVAVGQRVGGTSLATPDAPPMNECAPMRVNWWTPERPLMMA